MIKISFGANTNFNPLPRKEGDAACPFCFMPMLAFQSTPS